MENFDIHKIAYDFYLDAHLGKYVTYAYFIHHKDDMYYKLFFDLARKEYRKIKLDEIFFE